MVGREYTSDITNKYRYSFNGKEGDNEVKGDGYSIEFEARIYDSRLGRFLTTDPRECEYAWQSTYCYFKNSPIATLDLLGGGGPFQEEPESSSPKGNKPKDDQLPNCNFKNLNFLNKVKAIALFTVSPSFWTKNGFHGLVTEKICCGGFGGKKVMKKPDIPDECKKWNQLKSYIKQKVSTYGDILKSIKPHISIGLTIYNVVIFDMNINADKGSKENYFPGKEEPDGSKSEKSWQFFYRVEDGTETHLNKGHLFFFWGKHYFCNCIDGEALPDLD